MRYRVHHKHFGHERCIDKHRLVALVMVSVFEKILRISNPIYKAMGLRIYPFYRFRFCTAGTANRVEYALCCHRQRVNRSRIGFEEPKEYRAFELASRGKLRRDFYKPFWQRLYRLSHRIFRQRIRFRLRLFTPYQKQGLFCLNANSIFAVRVNDCAAHRTTKLNTCVNSERPIT